MHAKSSVISAHQLAQALHLARTGPPGDGAVWQALVQQGLDQDELAAALLRWQEVHLMTPGQWASARHVRPAPYSGSPPNWVLLDCADGLLALCLDPWNPAVEQSIAGGKAPVRLALARPGELQRAAALPPVAGGTDLGKAQPDEEPVLVPTSGDASSDVVSFVDQAIRRALDERASDIHFESHRHGIRVKFRLDGVMVPGPTHEGTQFAEELLSRIKVLAQLDITERRRPQDGRFRWTGGLDVAMDMRVSIMPSLFGEDAVLRLLDRAQLHSTDQPLSLDSLGFAPDAVMRIRALAQRPHGMLLVTGPTGSGKTTTVYAALSEVNDGLEKIVTIEDPVEYELPGVLQIPVNEQKGLSFATGLRSILRHDPDKILVGEIRDSETAQIAVQSSLTGHLVFTTVHANSLFDVIGRFQHFEIDPFALASALNGVVVQRLLRRACTHCRQWRDQTGDEAQALAQLGIAPIQLLPRGTGCPYCRHTGYRGRLVVAEVHTLDDTLRDHIVRGSSLSELRALLYAEPDRRLLAQAVDLVREGVTTIEEVRRVVGLA